jgi:AraC-like DNA-binding protein
MKTITRPLFVLHDDAGFRRRLAEVTGEEYSIHQVKGWNELRDAIREAPPAAVVVADPFSEMPPERGPSAEVRALLSEFPSVPMVAAFETRTHHGNDVRTLGDWGVVEVISLGHDDTAPGVAHRLRGARGRPMRSRLENLLPHDTSGRARAILDAAVDVVMVQGHGRDVAADLGLSRRTLLRWCEQAGLPPPRKLLAWMRILLAAELLDDPGRTVLSVAQVCGYSSDSSLRRVTQKFLGMSPTELRRRGAFPIASRNFIRVLAATRKK